MPEIKQLSPSVINKIAAGEVIERPASVVKELMENAVDAGSTRVDVAVEKGGTELIRIADNGCGIAPEQLTLAVASHATSKISDAEDLFNVHTLGFRGEALASIAEISRVLIRSRTDDDQAGAEIEVDGGRRRDVAPCGCPVGTIIEVRQLFFNTPVRRKFMRTTQTEMGHVAEAFTRIALAYPNIHFTLRHNDRAVYELPPVESWRERIATLFGYEIGDSLIAVEGDDGAVKLTGYVADPTVSRSNNRMQYLFLNGRHIRDRALQHALGEAYRGLLLTGRYPVVFLQLQLSADAVDVNVHPTKLEVRFQDSGRVYSQLLGTLRQKFLSTDLTAKVRSEASPSDKDPAAAMDANTSTNQRQQFTAWAKGGEAQNAEATHGADQNAQAMGGEAMGGDAAARQAAPRQSALDFRFDRMPGSTPDFKPFPNAAGAAMFGRSTSGNAAAAGTTADGEPQVDDHPHPSNHANGTASGSPATPAPTDEQLDHWVATAASPRSRFGMQVHNRYLITENQEGVMIIDQHALHERILYEQLRKKVLAGNLDKQQLLVPEPVSLTPAEAATALEAKETLSEMGIEIEAFGGDTILVSSYPAMLSNFNPSEVLREIVEGIRASGKKPEARDLLDDMLHMISCKAAIKAGDRLAPDEVAALLEQRHLFQDTHHCPHGRPTALVFTNEELDKRFQRT